LSEPDTEVWKLVAYNNNNNKVKSQKRDTPSWSELASFTHPASTTNRFSPLSNLLSGEHVFTQKIHKTTDTYSKANKIPMIINGISIPYSELSSATLKQDDSSNITSPQTKMKNIQCVKSLNKVKHTVLLIGDSHARNCAQLLQDILSTDFKVSSFVKPGACMNEVTNSVREELKTLNNDDFVVVWGGANDIRKNNMKEALNSMTKFVKENNGPNVVLINSPLRYDMIPESWVNQEVIKYNRQVRKILKSQSKVNILELNLNRNSFTIHGLHLKIKGKKLVSQDLVRLVQHSLNEKPIHSTISIPWKDPSRSSLDFEPQDVKINEVTNSSAHLGSEPLDEKINEELNNLALPSHPQKNCPARRNPDILWT
jgi:lysophospholipase L1-like esterase